MVILAIFLYAPLPGTCMGEDLRFDFIYLRFDNSPKCTTLTTLRHSVYICFALKALGKTIRKF